MTIKAVAEKKEPTWQDQMNVLQEKIVELQKKEQAMNEAAAKFDATQKEYNLVAAEVESMRSTLNNTIGLILGTGNQKVRQFG